MRQNRCWAGELLGKARLLADASRQISSLTHDLEHLKHQERIKHAQVASFPCPSVPKNSVSRRVTQLGLSTPNSTRKNLETNKCSIDATSVLGYEPSSLISCIANCNHSTQTLHISFRRVHLQLESVQVCKLPPWPNCDDCPTLLGSAASLVVRGHMR